MAEAAKSEANMISVTVTVQTMVFDERWWMGRVGEMLLAGWNA